MTAHEAERFISKTYPGAWSYLDKKIRFYEVEIPKIKLYGTPEGCFVEKKVHIICKDKTSY